MRGLLLYVVTLISRCHAHLRRDIPAIGKADHEEHYRNNQSFDDDARVDSKTEPLATDVANVISVTNAKKLTNAASTASTANSTNVTNETHVTNAANTTNMTNVMNATLVNYVDNDIRINLNPDQLATNIINVTLAGRVEDWLSRRRSFHGDPRGDNNGTLDKYGSKAEYYGNVVSCAGKTFLLTRMEVTKVVAGWLKEGWQTRVRDLGDFSKNVAELPYRILAYNTLSHNIAGVCVNDEVILVGGQFRKKRSEPHWQGVHISRTKPTSLAAFAEISRPTLLFPGNHKGCVETRDLFRGECEFDGRFSLIHFRDRFILYARANIPTRYVQITNSTDLETWSPFQLIDVEGVGRAHTCPFGCKMKSQFPSFPNPEYEISIYFLTAAVMEKDEWIAGYFPGIIQTPGRYGRRVSAGVHITWSKDGFHWVKPTAVFDAYHSRNKGPYYMMHPAGIFHNRLMTHQPKALEYAFKISQEFRTGHLLEDMNQTLQLSVLGRKYQLLGAPAGDAVVYDEEAWNE